MKEKIFLIDAYALVYRSYYALIRSPRFNSKGMNTSAVMGFMNTILEVLTKEQPTHLAVAFDHGKTFRHEAYPPYKAQREETPEDIKISVPIIKDILSAMNIPILQVDGYEADDIIGTIAKKIAHRKSSSQEEGHEETVYLLTPDKDYAQLVEENIFMYKPRHGGGYDIMGPKEICEKYTISSTDQVIDLLALMGDSADNFPGCPGVGEKTAIKLINQFGSCEELINRAAEVKGALGKKVAEHIEDIRISKFLARICTEVPTPLDDNQGNINLDAMKIREYDNDRLASLLDELELRNIKQKLIGGSISTEGEKKQSVKKSKKVNKNDNLQLDLFAEFATEGAGDDFQAQEISLKREDVSYHLIDNEEDARNLCDFILTNDFVCFDTETTSKSTISAKLVGMSFSVRKNEAWYVSLVQSSEFRVHSGEKNHDSSEITNMAMLEVFRPFFENDKITKIGQNMKYDIEVLARHGIEVRGPKYDTMIAHYLLHPELRHGMDYMAETMLNYKTIHYDDIVPRGKTMADIPASSISDYACEDADITLQLWNILCPELKEVEGLWQLFTEIEMPLVDVLADMELTGVRIETETLKEVSRLFTERMLEHEKKAYELAGHQFNISSPRQVGQVLFDEMKVIEKPKKTKTGQYVTSEEVLQQLAKDHPIVGEILAYRGLKKLIGTYVDALPQLVNPETMHIHTSFNQCVTATGRLSSSDPNLQNIPVRGEDGKEIRKCFVPDEGCLFFSADYSQIELRVMAHLSEDEEMIRAFREGWDIHASTAANVYHKERQDVTRDERTKAKRANFGIIYGISAWGLSQSLEIDRQEAKALMDGFFQTFPKVQHYMQQSIDVVKQEALDNKDKHAGDNRFAYGYARTLLHRRRKLDNIISSNATVRSFDERNAINAPIQGSAADIIKIAMVRIFRRFKEENIRSKMILQVHDELNFSVYPDEKEKVEKIVLEEMQRAYPLSVPLVADSGWGENWLEAH